MEKASQKIVSNLQRLDLATFQVNMEGKTERRQSLKMGSVAVGSTDAQLAKWWWWWRGEKRKMFQNGQVPSASSAILWLGP